METKTFEVRDKGTFVPVLATKLGGGSEADRYLFGRAGYGISGENHRSHVILWRLEGGKATYDPYDWGSRTMTSAHNHILKNWDALPSGSVVDVEFILGETDRAKVSESAGIGNK